MNRSSGKFTHRGLLATAMTSAANAIFIADRDGRIVWINDAFGRSSGYAKSEIIGRTPSFLNSGRQNAAFYRELWQTILAGKVWRGEVIERRKDRSFYVVDETVTPLRDEAGNVTHYVAIQSDITERQREVERDRYLAYHDDLTGLSNRVLFLSVLERAIGHSRAIKRSLALLFVDLDRFKPINDTLGHLVGDRLLVAVGKRLTAAVRKADTVARLGGDEFAIIQTDIDDAGAATILARKLLRALSQPFRIDGHSVHTSASIGMAVYPVDGTSPDELLKNADKAMYAAKNAGRNRFRFPVPAPERKSARSVLT